MLLEVKTKSGRLKKSQERWMLEWRGHSCVVRSPEEACQAVLDHVKNHRIR